MCLGIAIEAGAHETVQCYFACRCVHQPLAPGKSSQACAWTPSRARKTADKPRVNWCQAAIPRSRPMNEFVVRRSLVTFSLLPSRFHHMSRVGVTGRRVPANSLEEALLGRVSVVA